MIPAPVLTKDATEPKALLELQDKQSRFEETILPHLDAAYSLARWLTRNEHDAEDVVQDAYLRAYKYFASYRGENLRAWLLAVVRRAAYDWLQRNRPAEIRTQTDIDTLPDIAAEGDPEQALL